MRGVERIRTAYEHSSSGVVVIVVVMMVGEGIEYVFVSKRGERGERGAKGWSHPPLPRHTYKFQTYSTSLTEAKSNGVRPLEC